MGWLIFTSFAILVLLNVPIAYSLILSSIIYILVTNSVPIHVVAQKMFTAVDTFTIMAVPFFMIAGNLMDKGGISRRLINFASKLVGSLPGGLGMVTILASMFFAAISGSGPATVAAIGAIMVPAMIKAKYDEGFATALQATAGYIGVVIPPSIPMVTFGVVTGVSIGALFLSGFLPGLIVGLCLMAVTYVVAKKNGYVERQSSVSFKEVLVAFKEAFLALLMPVIILGGIYGGVFTPTEAANVAVVYAIVIGVFIYKELTWREVFEIFCRSSISSAIVLLIISTAAVFGLILTREMIPNQVASWMLDIAGNKYVLLLLINLMLLIVGTFMETNAAIIILAPILFPVVTQMGIDPIHFGLMMVLNLAIGMITPPLGVNLFVASSMTKLSIERIAKANWGFLIASLIALLLITFIPSISLLLPKLFMK
ncbi:TRAP transporter large permease [Desulfallas sp. Bu1-1]|uniref:TRAP transporter large permease n=1 Tax=Desulfallas sp. Bu1-1 TaxID=2787620 RepID=UPI00189D2595|nr:TRAP transporter large permease [Desulfallas sp. Bu1-1]MBF7084064.1 TRAP transporter large permease [Desulfallas sp. Bu1-1]